MTALLVALVLLAGTFLTSHWIQARRRRRLRDQLMDLRHLFDERWRSGDTLLEKITRSDRPPLWHEYEYVHRRGDVVYLWDGEDRRMEDFSLEEASRLINVRQRRYGRAAAYSDREDQEREALRRAFTWWKKDHFPNTCPGGRQGTPPAL